jgi:general secretion pathway protein D
VPLFLCESGGFVRQCRSIFSSLRAGAGRSRWAALGLLAVILAACSQNLGSRLLEPGDVDLGAKQPGTLRSHHSTAAPPAASRSGYQLFEGSGLQAADDEAEPPPGVVDTNGKYTINIDKAGINEAAKLILSETLGLNYLVDPRVQGTITLSTARPLTGPEVLEVFEAALRLNGAALVQSDGAAKVVALQELLEGELGSVDKGDGQSFGYGLSAVPLKYIGPSNMLELLDSFIARAGSVRASAVGNMILVRGTSEERRSLVEVIRSFDVDWMKQQTASIAILSNSTPDEMTSKLEAVFAQDTSTSGNNRIRVVPLERLNGVVVIGNSKSKVRRALQWVQRFDKRGESDTNYYVYAVENGNAEALAKILIATFVDKSGDAGRTAEVAPDVNQVQVNTAAQTNQQPGNTEQAESQDAADPAAPPAIENGPETPGAEQPSLAGGIRITPNPANNSIVIRATQREYRKILQALRSIDTPSVQVLINTTIAEVTLNDDLRYGVQAYLKSHNDVAGGISTGSALSIKPSFPGLNFLIGNVTDPRVVLDALSAVTRVRVVSSPSILVLENETATIKVGDRVPVKTQTVVRDVSNVDSFEYQDTGVILKVRPRVNHDGLVTMDLGQELSSVAASGSGAGGNPTFSQRAITSKVSVYSTQTVVLGGLISGQDSREKNSVPGINKIPIIGDLVGKTENKGKRSELIVFITPQIVQDAQDASRISKELRAKFHLQGLE